MKPEESMSLEPDEAQEELVAYLDGELSPEERVRVERRLADEPDYRFQLRQLQQSWDMLDALPRSEVNPQFARTTLEMVAVSTQNELSDFEQRQTKRERWLRFGGLAAMLLAALAGYLLFHSTLPDPNEQLLRDLPVLEQFDRYRQAESLSFLKRLQQEGLFAEEVSDEE